MTTKKFLSEKKTSTQNISISPALKDWVKRYVKKMQEEHPDVEDYKSISAFHCAIMEKVLTIFKKGKNLDDFDRMMDKAVDQQYSGMSGFLFLPIVEGAVINNTYTDLDSYAKNPLTANLSSFYRRNIDPNDVNSIFIIFERLKKRYMTSGSTISMDLEKLGDKWILTHTGTYTYIHYLNIKFLVAILGLIGARLIEVEYSKELDMFQLMLELTDAYYSTRRGREVKKERIKLFKENVEFFTNYYRVLKDEAIHSWIKLADDQELVISFKSFKVFSKKMRKVEADIIRFGFQEDLLIYLLRFFHNIHWIRIINEDELSFELDITKENNSKEIEYLINYLSMKGTLAQDDNKYYLEKTT